jgi:hypothetical protein
MANSWISSGFWFGSSTGGRAALAASIAVLSAGVSANAVPASADALAPAVQQRVTAAQTKLHTAEAALGATQPELAKHMATAQAALKQFRTAPKTTSAVALSALLDSAKTEYATCNVQAATVEKQVGDAHDASEELRQILQANRNDAATKKAVGAPLTELAAKSQKTLSQKLKVAADELEAAQATLLVESARAAPTAHGPGACDIRKTDWLNLKFPASDSFNGFQLKRGSVDVDGGPDPMNNSRVTFSFQFARVDFGDTDSNGITEAFVRVDEAGAGYEQQSHQLLFAFEDDPSCAPKPLANAELGFAKHTAMGPTAYFEESDDGTSEWRLAFGRLVQTKVGAPLPFCQGGLSPGRFSNGKQTLNIPNNCSDQASFNGPKYVALSRGGISPQAVDGQTQNVIYMQEGDTCWRYGLTASKSGSVSVRWLPDLSASINRNATVVRGCEAGGGEYKRVK